MTGVLKVQTTKEFGESTVSKILDLVENASSCKSKSEDFILKFAKVYTSAVCYAALALASLPPVVRMFFMGLSADPGVWVYRALTFLVISCPCALVISIPLSFFAGIGGASKEGVLAKGFNCLEILSQTKYVVFDKTGTMTKGVFEVNGIHHSTIENEKLLEYAAIAELKKAGVERSVMLTGDAKKVANQVASSLGIDEVYSELLPTDKVEKVEELLR